MIEITGKNKERFIQYLHKLPSDIFYYKSFGEYPFEMQQGVLLAYYDSLGIHITLYENDGGGKWGVYITNKSEGLSTSNGYKHNSRNEAYQEAFKQADKLENEKLK